MNMPNSAFLSIIIIHSTVAVWKAESIYKYGQAVRFSERGNGRLFFQAQNKNGGRTTPVSVRMGAKAAVNGQWH